MERVPPNDLDAEASIISSMVMDQASIDLLIGSGFMPEYCYSDANRFIVESIYELHQGGGKIDPITLANHLRTKKRLEMVGGTPYLARLIQEVPMTVRVAEHATIVREAWRMRQVIKRCQLAVAEGYQPVESPQQFLEDLETNIAEIAHAGRVVTLERIGVIVQREAERLMEVRESGKTYLGTKTGFADLDKLTGGLFDGDLTVIGARPGLGKTSFLVSLLMNISRSRALGESGDATVLFSMEMPRSQLALRFVTHESSLDITTLRTSVLGVKQWDQFCDAAKYLMPLPVWVDDQASLTLMDLRAKIRKLKREIKSGAAGTNAKRLGAVGIDYLQLMTGITRKGGSREEEVASLSRGLKAIAKEEEVPIICLSQLNRQLEKNTKNKRPTLADLRESGAIEQDADNVWFLYRDSYYDREANKNEAELDVAKQRNGPTKSISLFFDPEAMRFKNSAEPWAQGDEDVYWDEQR
jgi:replicative DNA helicase